jgi:cytochrome c553
MSARLSPFAIACALVFALTYQTAALATQESVDVLIHTALTLDAHPQTGAVTYNNSCASCHNPNGEGNWRRNIPALAGQRLAYLVKQLADFSQQDRDGNTMHRVIATKSLDDPQKRIDLAAFINSLPPTSKLQIGPGTNISLGEAIFREQCSSCHEEDARGDDDGFVPALRNQHFAYLVRQMHGFINGHRRNVDRDLDLFLYSFKDDEIQATSDYLSRLKGPTKDRAKMRSNGVVSD